MKLLPPKPPISAGAAKATKKKTEIEETPKDLAAESNKNDSSENLQASTMPDADEQQEMPLISSVDEAQNLDATLASMNSALPVSDEPEKKKKGFFNRLFGKKADAQKNDLAVVPLAPAEVSGSNEHTLDSIASAESAKTESIPELEDAKENSISENAGPDAWNKDNESIPVFESSKGAKYSSDSKYKKGAAGTNSKYSAEYTSKYSSKNSLGRNYGDYDSINKYKKNADSFQSAEDFEFSKSSESNAISESEQSSESWDDDLSSSSQEEVVSKKAKAKSANSKKENSKEKTISNIEETSARRLTSTDDFSSPIMDWKTQSSALADNSGQDAKSKKILDAKLKKLLKVQETKLKKLQIDAKKSVQIELDKANRRIAELGKKEKSIKASEARLLHLSESLMKERNEFDELVVTEKELMKSKEVLEADVARYTNEVEGLKAELSKVRKEFAAERRNMANEKLKIQSDLKSIKDMFESERRKGEKKLSDLAKQVEQSEAILEETNRKNKDIAAKLRNKEMLLEQREKEITELIDQEQKILSVLKENEGSVSVHVQKPHRQKTQRPATMLGADGEPEIYSDDGDALSKRMEDCRDLLKEGNYEDAKLLYNELREEFLKAELDSERQKELNHDIRELYDEICLSIVSPKKK